jgi:hypothetical protein
MDRETQTKTRLAVLKANAKAKELVKSSGGEDVNDDGLPTMQKIIYSSLPVEIPDDFLLPLQDPDTIKVNQIDWSKTMLPEYKNCYAVILDNVLNEEECNQLLHMAECSAGGHLGDESVPDHGWRPAMVNAGRNYEFLDTRYRNSDRIIWDNQEVMKRIWKRILQGKGMKEYFSVLEGKKYQEVLGMKAAKWGDRWLISENGPNERLRFLKYGPGQFFKRTSLLPPYLIHPNTPSPLRWQVHNTRRQRDVLLHHASLSQRLGAGPRRARRYEYRQH